MTDPLSPLDEIHRHLADTLFAMADYLPGSGPDRFDELIACVRHLTAAQVILSRQSAAPDPRLPATASAGESDDERIERRAAESRCRVSDMLDGLCLSTGERAFAELTGGRLVDLVTDAYRDTVRRRDGFGGACVTAAVAVALTIVHDPPEAR